MECKTAFEIDDPQFPGKCPSCGYKYSVPDRCDTCPVVSLERVRERSEAGRLLERVLELDFDTQRLKIGWDEITCEEDAGLKILVQERAKWQNEETTRKQEESEAQRRIQEMSARR